MLIFKLALSIAGRSGSSTSANKRLPLILLLFVPPNIKLLLLLGRYEDDFVEGRRAQLETWLSRMGLHPIVSQSIVLQHFLTSHRQEKVMITLHKTCTL